MSEPKTVVPLIAVYLSKHELLLLKTLCATADFNSEDPYESLEYGALEELLNDAYESLVVRSRQVSERPPRKHRRRFGRSLFGERLGKVKRMAEGMLVAPEDIILKSITKRRIKR